MACRSDKRLSWNWTSKLLGLGFRRADHLGKDEFRRGAMFLLCAHPAPERRPRSTQPVGEPKLLRPFHFNGAMGMMGNGACGVCGATHTGFVLLALFVTGAILPTNTWDRSPSCKCWVKEPSCMIVAQGNIFMLVF